MGLIKVSIKIMIKIRPKIYFDPLFDILKGILCIIIKGYLYELNNNKTIMPKQI